MIPSEKNNKRIRYRRQHKSFFWSLNAKTTVQSKNHPHIRHYVVGWPI